MPLAIGLWRRPAAPAEAQRILGSRTQTLRLRNRGEPSISQFYWTGFNFTLPVKIGVEPAAGVGDMLKSGICGRVK